MQVFPTIDLLKRNRLFQNSSTHFFTKQLLSYILKHILRPKRQLSQKAAVCVCRREMRKSGISGNA